MKRSLLRCLLLVLTLCSQTNLAQGVTSGWSRVQIVQSGSKLMVRKKSGEKVQGRLKTIAPDSLTLSLSKDGSKEVEIKRDDVSEIRRKSAGHTALYAGLLGGLGFGAGYGIGYGTGEATNAEFPIEYPIAVIGAAAGATIGAIIGSKGDVIYKAP